MHNAVNNMLPDTDISSWIPNHSSERCCTNCVCMQSRWWLQVDPISGNLDPLRWLWQSLGCLVFWPCTQQVIDHVEQLRNSLFQLMLGCLDWADNKHILGIPPVITCELSKFDQNIVQPYVLFAKDFQSTRQHLGKVFHKPGDHSDFCHLHSLTLLCLKLLTWLLYQF